MSGLLSGKEDSIFHPGDLAVLDGKDTVRVKFVGFVDLATVGITTSLAKLSSRV